MSPMKIKLLVRSISKLKSASEHKRVVHINYELYIKYKLFLSDITGSYTVGASPRSNNDKKYI